MADYPVAAGLVGMYEIETVANTEDTVTFTDRSVRTLVITVHEGDSNVYFRIGSEATVKGDGCHVVPPGTTAEYVNPYRDETVVHIISKDDAVVSVSRA